MVRTVARRDEEGRSREQKLNHFETVAKYRNLPRPAAELNISQPAVAA